MQLNIAEEAALGEAGVQEETLAGVAENVPQQPNLVSLRRSGKRPISFRGVELAHGMSFRVGTPLWYEINVYQASTGSYVGNVRMFTKADGEQDKFSVHIAGSLEEVVDFLEHYNPADDIVVDIKLDDNTKSLADLTFEALALRARTENARAQYQSLVSEIFSQLDAARGAAEA